MKKNRGKKSRTTVPLNLVDNFLDTIRDMKDRAAAGPRVIYLGEGGLVCINTLTLYSAIHCRRGLFPPIHMQIRPEKHK
jgi:hypothetical protein